jgi:hypothetical protein
MSESLFYVAKSLDRLDVLTFVTSPTEPRCFLSARLVTFFATAPRDEGLKLTSVPTPYGPGYLLDLARPSERNEASTTFQDVDGVARTALEFIGTHAPNVGFDVDDVNAGLIPGSMLARLPQEVGSMVERCLLPKRPDLPGQYL